MNLPNGITGFYHSKNNTQHEVDGKQFKQECFTIVTSIGGKVLEFIDPTYPKNFYIVKVKVSEKQFQLLLNEHHPYLACAVLVEFGNIKVSDEMDLLNQFSLTYKVLSTGNLMNQYHSTLLILKVSMS